jgi:hypothetical protein
VLVNPRNWFCSTTFLGTLGRVQPLTWCHGGALLLVDCTSWCPEDHLSQKSYLEQWNG